MGGVVKVECRNCGNCHLNCDASCNPGLCRDCGAQMIKTKVQDENNIKSNSGSGRKHDSDKLRMDLIPPEVIEELGKVLTYGAMKYEPNNWQKVESYRYKAALLRHYTAWCKGEECDQESKLKHLSHMLCNVAFLLWIEMNQEKSKK